MREDEHGAIEGVVAGVNIRRPSRWDRSTSPGATHLVGIDNGD